MEVYFDFEFTGLSQAAQPISLGLVTEQGGELYCEFTDYELKGYSIADNANNDWLRRNVIAQLGGPSGPVDIGTAEYHVGTRAELMPRIEDWLRRNQSSWQRQQWRYVAAEEKLTMVGDTLAYDWVLFCELWGGALGLPSFISYIPLDLATLLSLKGVDPDISRAEYSRVAGGEHHALVDARQIKACWMRARARINE